MKLHYNLTMQEVMTWTFTLAVVFGLIAFGLAFLQIAQEYSRGDEFWIAKLCALCASLVFVTRVIIWTATSSRYWLTVFLATFVVCGLASAFAVMAIRYINHKQFLWTQKRQPQISARDQYKIDRLKDLIAQRENRFPDYYVPVKDLMLFDQSWNPLVNTLLENYFDSSHVERFKANGTAALHEFLQESIEGPLGRPLITEIKDSFLTTKTVWDFTGVYYFTVVIEITNTKPEPNTIKRCRLIVHKNGGDVEGEIQKNVYLRTNGDRRADESGIRPHVFMQGVPFSYSATFKFIESDNPFMPDDDSLSDKQFTVVLTDSYDVEYKTKGRTSPSFVKDHKGMHP